MIKILQVLRAVLIASSSVFLAVGAWLAYETILTERAITASTLHAETAITASITGLPELVNSHLDVLEHKVDTVTELASMTSDSLRRTTVFAIKKLDNRLESIQGDARISLNRANRSIALVAGAAAASLPVITKSSTDTLASISADVHTVAVPIAGTAAQLNDAAPLYLDCDSGNCLFNHIQGTSRAIDQTMKEIAKAAPQMAASAISIEGSAKSIAGDTAKEVHEFTKAKHWWAKLGVVLGL